MKKQQLLIVFLLNLFIALAFFAENFGAGFGQFSSDLHNSIPVCYKFDDPSLFPKDMFLNTLDNVRYYTPFYVQSIRFFGWIAGGDYLLGINIFATLLHLIFGFGWFLLFAKLFKHFGLALVLSVLIRGIIWLPGFEIWGISDLWTMMPRTLYAAFLPFPFLLLLQNKRKFFLAAALLIGIIFNFHPITGMGGMLLFMLLVALYAILWRKRLFAKDMVLGFALMIVGMLPFIATYFTQTDAHAVYDVAEYKRAFFTRIPEFFEQPPSFLKLWFRGSSVFFFGPMLLFLLYSFFIDARYRKLAVLLASLSVMLIAIFSVSVYVEDAVNAVMGTNLRMAFQIIRAQKLAILPGYFAIGFLIKIAFERIPASRLWFKYALPLFLLALVFAKFEPLNRLPFFKDDIASTIFPDWHYVFVPIEKRKSGLEHMTDYIAQNTPKDAVFYGSFMIRSASRRSVVLDGKGASMLIEGNPVAFIQWYRDTEALKKCTDDRSRVAFLKSKMVNYVLSTHLLQEGVPVELLHTEEGFYLYKID